MAQCMSIWTIVNNMFSIYQVKKWIEIFTIVIDFFWNISLEKTEEILRKTIFCYHYYITNFNLKQ